ncbi:hypothetical protein MTO96_023062 [Rhipicephalus appendiculatus]
MWAYDAKLGQCTKFVYGGCDGNDNKYPTKEKCDKTCKKSTPVPSNPVCSLPKSSGPCLAYMPRYYYNSANKKCEQFIYGGCQGNANNFWTLEECSKTCKPTNPVCYEPVEVGPCKAYVPRYFYNTTTKFCERFVYGGCQGNGNNFPELEVCLKACKVGYENVTERLLKLRTRDRDLASATSPRYYYNTTTNTCEQFVYGGCRGNANNFETLHKCESKCGISLEDVIRANPILSREVVGLNPVCNETKYPGPCAGYFPRYYFDNVTEDLREVHLRRMPGQRQQLSRPSRSARRHAGNRHLTRSCSYYVHAASLDQHSLKIVGAFELPHWPFTPPEVCTFPADAGPCEAYMPRFFYNTLTKTCEQFVYGGCGGNGNNFLTFDACEKKSDSVGSVKTEGPYSVVFADEKRGEAKHAVFQICKWAADDFGAVGDFDPQCTPTADPGPCRGYFPMWWYNVLSGRCEDFIYGGCKGNKNKYKTKEECERTCVEKSMNEFACSPKPDAGPCRASVKRYYFDTAFGTCLTFIYGGCEGNPNNYETEEECKASCNPTTDYEAKCLAKAETGPCMAHLPLWAYDAKLGECKIFTYGGCDGNANKYPSEETCEKTCKNPTPELVEEYAMASQHLDVHKGNPCESRVLSAPGPRGHATAHIPRYYYNSKTKRCDLFVYGGCQGNANNFVTLSECIGTCNVKLSHGIITFESEPKPTNPVCYEPKKVGPCKAYVPRYFYNTTTKFCERFIYGGCQGNGNNFPELDVCLKTCKVGYENVTERLLKQQTPVLDPVCELPKKVGPCYAYVPRYYYNTTTDTCEKFVYGGCQGNANNFETLKECETRCGGNYTVEDQSWKKHIMKPLALEDVIRANPILSRDAVEVYPGCDEPKDHGPCNGYIPRYYFNNASKTCEQFIFGGCQANGNNFESVDECMNRCWGERFTSGLAFNCEASDKC